MSDTVRYLDRKELEIILWAPLEGRVLSGKSTFLRRIRFKGIQEVRSGAIIPDESTPGFFVLELNTATGPRKFHHAEEVTGGDVQSDSDPILWETVHFAEAISHVNYARWVSRERPSTQGRHAWIQSVARSKSIPHTESAADDEQEHAPGDILRKLNDPHLSTPTRQRLIIEAEVLDFTGDLAASLTGLLRQFIDDRRESNAPSDLVAVASAIRKFVATAGTEEAFDYAASLLKASGRSPLSIELELEVTKMVVRKLTANPPASNESLSDLAARLNELAETYLNPRLLAREKHGAIALNAVMGLVLTRDRLADDVIRRVHGLGVAWFQQLVGRRASQLKKDLEQRGLGDPYRDLLEALDELRAVVSSNTSK